MGGQSVSSSRQPIFNLGASRYDAFVAGLRVNETAGIHHGNRRCGGGMAVRCAGKLPIIGMIGPATAEHFRPFREQVVQRLGELGWIEGRNIVVEFRSAEGGIDRAGEAAAEFARMRVAVILIGGDSEVLAAKRAAATIPIVAVAVGDPVGNGLVESLARPGGNVTGMALALSETAGKRLELLREVVPALKRVAIFSIAESVNPLVATERNAAIAAAHALGLETITSEVRTVEDIEPTIGSLKGTRSAGGRCRLMGCELAQPARS